MLDEDTDRRRTDAGQGGGKGVSGNDCTLAKAQGDEHSRIGKGRERRFVRFVPQVGAAAGPGTTPKLIPNPALTAPLRAPRAQVAEPPQHALARGKRVLGGTFWGLRKGQRQSQTRG